MPAFDPLSRYARLETYAVTDHRGRTVSVVALPEPPVQAVLGWHVLKQGERLDHLAFRYLGDAAGFWRIAEANDAMLPDALAEARTLAVPSPAR